MVHIENFTQPNVRTADPAHEVDVDGFTAELTKLSHTYGIAITNSPPLIIMEQPDFAYAYECDADGHLALR